MATSNSFELGEYKPVQEQPRQNSMRTVTWWDLIENAAKAKRRSNIQVFKFPITQKEIDKFVDKFDITVKRSDPEPREVSRVLVDINVKEYANCGEKENDETIVKIEKTSSSKQGRRYNFSTSKGVNWGFEGNVGAKKILELGLGASYSRSKEKKTEEETSEEDEFVFAYNQEEKVTIPPGKKAKVKVITSTVKYQQGYTLKFSISSYYTIPVRYKDLGCCGLRACLCGSSLCHVSAREILKTLPEFKEEGGKVSFTQEGLLEWVGEGCSVQKLEETVI